MLLSTAIAFQKIELKFFIRKINYVDGKNDVLEIEGLHSVEIHFES